MRRRGAAALRSLPWVVVASLLLPAISITLARILEPDYAVAVQLQALTPLAIPLYSLATVLLVAQAALVRWRRGRWRTVAWPIALVSVAGVALHGWWFAPHLTGEVPAADAGAERVTVLTANLLVGRADPDALVEQVRRDRVDVLVASEITTGAVSRLDHAGLASVLRYRVGVPGAESSSDGTMVFAREPVELVERLATDMESMLVTVGDLLVLAAHPSPPVLPDLWREDHALLSDVVSERRPDLIVGDLNATNDHRPLRDLYDVGYRDAIELTNGGFRPTWPNDGGVGLIGKVSLFGPVAQMDHVLVGEHLTVLETSTRDLYGSDHRAVLATVAPRSAPPSGRR